MSSPTALSPPPLLQPCMKGNLDQVKRLVGTFLATYSRNDVGYVQPGSDEILQNYVNQVDASGNAAIHASVFCGHLAMTQFLVDACGASYTVTNSLGCSPLWLSAGYNHVDVLEYLLSRSMEESSQCKEALLATNNTGDTALLAAASRGNVESCKVLLETATKLGIREEMVHCRNHSGDSPFSVAVAGGYDNKDEGNEPILLEMLFALDLLNGPNQQHLTPLLIACERNWPKTCKFLMDKGASLDVCDSKGTSPLAVAAFCGNDEVVQQLLLQSSSINSNTDFVNIPNHAGCTPLWLCARAGRASTAQILLDAGADLTKANKHGLTPVDVAVKYKRKDVEQVFEAWQE